MTATTNTNFINFSSRDWGYRGDKGTWVRQNDDGTYTLKVAARGTLSRGYTEELREFCAKYGQDFDSIRCGESITFAPVEAAQEKVEKKGRKSMTMTVTAAQISALAAANCEENLYTWNDGAESWTLDNLAEALGDEALEGMGPDSEITLTADGLSEAGREIFAAAFISAAPDWYTGQDADSATPWCAPWEWTQAADWFDGSLSPAEMGERWADLCRDDMAGAGLDKICPRLRAGAVIVREDEDAPFYEGYVTLTDGTYIRLRGDGTGTDSQGRDWTSVSRDLGDDDYEFLGWALTSDLAPLR